MDLEKIVAEPSKDSEQRMLRLNVSIVGQSRVGKLTRSPLIESINAVDAVVPQFGHGALSQL